MKRTIEKALRTVAANHGLTVEEVKRQIEEAYRLRTRRCETETECSAEETVMQMVRLVLDNREKME